MSQCSIEDLGYIKHIIDTAFLTQDDVQIKDLESEISDLVIDDFQFKDYRENQEIINTLKKYGVDTDGYFEGDTQSYSLKSNVVKNISTYHTDDLFKGIPVAKSYFEGYLDQLVVKEAIINSKEASTYVSTDIELSNNFHNLKNKLFLEIQQFLRKKGILLTDPVDLYNTNKGINDYNYYKTIMGMISDFFFNENTIDLITYSNNSVPNLNINLERNEELFKAYNNAIILSNFDSIINNKFKGMIEVNYNYFNHLNSIVGDTPKYRLAIAANSLLYWNNDTHDSKSSENKEDRITKMVINSIPVYNKRNQKKAEFLEMKDMYLLAAAISDFELLYGNTLKNRGVNFDYFNNDSNNRLEWYINEIKKAVNATPDHIPEILKVLDYNKIGSRYSLKNALHTIYSLDNFLNDPELNIKVKEQSATNSLVSIISQIINNNYGSTYSVFDTKEGWKMQKMYSQDFNNTSINNTILEYLKSNKSDTTMFDLKAPKESAKFNNIFNYLKEGESDIKIAFANNPEFSIALKEYLSEKTGVHITTSFINEIINSLLDFNPITDYISVNFFKNKLEVFINSLNKDFKSKALSDSIEGISSVSTGKILNNTVSDAFYKAFSEAYLIDEVVKPVMNIETSIGNKVPSFRTSTVTFKDTELFDLQRKFQNEQGGYFKSLFLGNDPVILGTSTKLDVTNDDITKDAVKLTVAENFQADFKYEFLESITKNNTFQILLGNYSDKNSIFTKIINANFTLEGHDKPLLQQSIGNILQVVKDQGQAYYTDTFIKIFSDYKSLLTSIGIDTSSLVVEGFDISTFENNINFLNDILSKYTMDELFSMYAELPHSEKDPNLSIMEEMHYSSYNNGVFINQFLADNYRIFSNDKLFKSFVIGQERLFKNKLDSDKIPLHQTSSVDYNNWTAKLGLTNADFKGSNKNDVTLSDNSLNPLLRKWMWMNALFRNEYLFITAKGEYMHPHKIKDLNYRQGNFDQAYWADYFKEGSGRLVSMGKRNVLFTAVIETPTRHSKGGVPDQINIAAIKDFKADLHTTSGYIKNGQDVHDGSSFIDDTYSRMLSASFPGKGYKGTMKQFGTLITRNGVTIKKDAESVITNDRLRNSLNSQIKLLNKKQQMLGIPLNDIDLKYSKTFTNEFFFNNKGQIYRISNIELNGNQAIIGLQLKNGENSWNYQETSPITVNTLYDIWNAIGGMYSVDQYGNFNEGSNELLYDIVINANNGELKNKIIHVISNGSSLKAGASNLNARNYWTNSKNLLYTTYDNRFMGPQLDASHGVDSSEIKEITQLVSALAQGGFTTDLALEAYNDIASVIKQSASKYMKGLSSNNSHLYKYLTDKFIQTIERSKGEGIAKNLIDSIKEDGVKIPFSNPNFFNLFVKDVIVRLNDEFISRYYSGIGSVLIPSHGIIQLYDIPTGDGTYRVATQEDLIKEALDNHNEDDFRLKYGVPSTNNYQIVQTYIQNLLQNLAVSIGEIEIGDTVIWNGKEETLNTPEKYYDFKKSQKIEYNPNNINFIEYQLGNISNLSEEEKISILNYAKQFKNPLLIFKGMDGKSNLDGTPMSIHNIENTTWGSLSYKDASTYARVTGDIGIFIEEDSGSEVVEVKDNIPFTDLRLAEENLVRESEASIVYLNTKDATTTEPHVILKWKPIPVGILNVSGNKLNIPLLKQVIKIQSKPRDLKPTMHTFKLGQETKNIFDLDSVRLLYKLKNITDNLGKDIDYTQDNDFNLLNNLANYFSQNITKNTVDLYQVVNSKNKDLLKALEKRIRSFIQREYQLLEKGLVLKSLTPESDLNIIFNGDLFTGHIDDFIENYRNNSNLINSLQFRHAEKILGDIYQSNFGRDINDSMYSINKLGHNYFKEKLMKYYDKDTTDADLKIFTSKSENPIYIKFVDELGPLDRSINIKSISDSEDELRKIPVRFNEQGEEIYTITDPDRMRVSTNEEGKEFIYIKYGSYFNGNKQKGYHKYINFERNLNNLLKSFKGSIQTIVPIMNRDFEPIDIFTYKKNDAGKSIIDGTIPFNLNKVTADIYKKYIGFHSFLDDYYDSSWFEVNKDDILDKISKSMFASWQKSHELIDARIPGQSMQSFMPMKNVAYMKTKTNDSYVSVLEIFLQGSDFKLCWNHYNKSR